MKGNPWAEAGSKTCHLLAIVFLDLTDRAVELTESAFRQTREWVPPFLHWGQE